MGKSSGGDAAHGTPVRKRGEGGIPQSMSHTYPRFHNGQKNKKCSSCRYNHNKRHDDVQNENHDNGQNDDNTE